LFGEQMVRGMTIAQQKKLPERMQIVVPNLTLSMVEQTGPFIMAGVIGAAPWTWNVPYEYGFERGQQFGVGAGAQPHTGVRALSMQLGNRLGQQAARHGWQCSHMHDGCGSLARTHQRSRGRFQRLRHDHRVTQELLAGSGQPRALTASLDKLHARQRLQFA